MLMIIQFLLFIQILNFFSFLKSVLESDSLNLISWFEEISMKANHDKFLAKCIRKKTYDSVEIFRIGETDIKCENNVSLLGVNIDFMLSLMTM